MSKIATIAAAAALSGSVAVFVSVPAFAADEVSEATARQAAVTACVGFNSYGPAGAVEAVGDGMGDWLVWVKDKDSDLWMCNASAKGNVYAYALIQGDLLKGDGAQAISYVPVAAQAATTETPAGKAEQLCAAVGGMIEDVKVVATVEDGVGDYLVWLQGANDAYWVCNASADAKLYVFEPVQYPLNGTGATSEAAGPPRIA